MFWGMHQACHFLTARWVSKGDVLEEHSVQWRDIELPQLNKDSTILECIAIWKFLIIVIVEIFWIPKFGFEVRYQKFIWNVTRLNYFVVFFVK